MKNKFFILGGVAFVSLCGCNDYSLMFNKDKIFQAAVSNGVIVYQNGFGSSETGKMTKKLARRLNMAHICGDSRELAFKLMEKGQDSKYGNHIIFHSMGSSFAYELARDCSKKGIKVKKAHSLEAFTKQDFPENVGEVVNYTAPGKWIFGEHCCSGENGSREYVVKKADHLSLPQNSREFIWGEIVRDSDIIRDTKPQRREKNLSVEKAGFVRKR